MEGWYSGEGYNPSPWRRGEPTDMWAEFTGMLNKEREAREFAAEKEQKGESQEEASMSSVEEFLILALKDLFHIDHFMTDQGNHIFIDNDPGYYKEKHIWRFTPEELKTKLLALQSSLSASPH